MRPLNCSKAAAYVAASLIFTLCCISSPYARASTEYYGYTNGEICSLGDNLTDIQIGQEFSAGSTAFEDVFATFTVPERAYFSVLIPCVVGMMTQARSARRISRVR
jgi:hypothetical protein